jgi:CrcB protein
MPGVHANRAELAAVFAGGFAGAMARAGVAEGLTGGGGWPWATFAVNVAGAALLGWVVTRYAAGSTGRSLLATGFCGALTTFSTMQLELLELFDDGRVVLAVGYALTSVAAGLAAVAVTSRRAAAA